jgi:serine protease inhibitor
MSLVFGEHADLSNMVEGLPAGESLYVSNVFHKGFVEANEKGT